MSSRVYPFHVLCTLSPRVRIASFRDCLAQGFLYRGERHKRIPADLADRLFLRLQVLDDAVCDSDLRIPPSNHFEKLKGKLDGFDSVRVNLQWRLLFRWNGALAAKREM
jgi:toxin HigB-1